MHSRSLLVAVLSVAHSFSITSAADWPQWLGPTRNGVSSEAVERWDESPAVVWRQAVGGGFSTPVVANGLVYVHAAVEGKSEEQVTAFDIETGELRWSQTYARGPYRSALGVSPRATPSVDAHHLVTFGITGELACFDAESGAKVWQINPYNDNQVALPGFGACSSPLVHDQFIYIPVGGSNQGVAAYDLATGKQAWTALDEPASSASPILWQRGEGEQRQVDVVTQSTLRIAGLDPQTGTVRWEYPLVFQPSGVSPTPLVTQNRLICTTQDTGTLAVESPRERNSETARSWWHQHLTSYFSTGTMGADGRVFLITNAIAPLPRADVVCINPEDGKELWTKSGLGYFHVGLIATANDRLLVLDDSGTLILADADRERFQELCRAKVCDGTFVNPVLSNGRLIVRDGNALVCVRLKALEVEE